MCISGQRPSTQRTHNSAGVLVSHTGPTLGYGNAAIQHDGVMDTPLHGSSLKDALAATPAPSAGDAEDYTIAASFGVGYLARARSGAPTFLVPLVTSPVASVGR